MGIRHYAYAFDADIAPRVRDDPTSAIGDDPLADAWGMPHGERVAVPSFRQSVPKTEMLFLDSAWPALQALTRPGAGGVPRPAYRMFEGQATMTDRGWIPWVRAVLPDEVARIAEDVVDLRGEVRVKGARGHGDDAEMRECLESTVEFVTGVAVTRRGFAYMIG